mmetsp:Transcript_43428/g.130264  ORF Transcript_43428/g.130264 Transcript_43428/m.130264 type:complete len:160 (-) Transcript_43428:315-794(-)|eukprot:354654-Chlamydomonas_euryale.AAC.2
MTYSRPSHRRVPSEVIVNKNVSWVSQPSVWAWYFGLVIAAWLVASAFTQDTGMAWTYVHLVHGVVSYYLLHWIKGTPFAEDDQGQYCRQTFWEQLDNGVYATFKRKVFTAVPVVLFLLATNGTDFRKQPLGLNLVVVLVLVIAKLPALHKVRFFGINKY